MEYVWILDYEPWIFSIVGGIVAGLITGLIIEIFFYMKHKRDRKKAIIYVHDFFIKFENEINNIRQPPPKYQITQDQPRLVIFKNYIRKALLIIEIRSSYLEDGERDSIVGILDGEIGTIEMFESNKLHFRICSGPRYFDRYAGTTISHRLAC